MCIHSSVCAVGVVCCAVVCVKTNKKNIFFFSLKGLKPPGTIEDEIQLVRGFLCECEWYLLHVVTTNSLLIQRLLIVLADPFVKLLTFGKVEKWRGSFL